MKIDEQLKTIDKITNRAIKKVELERKNKPRNYFIEIIKYCQLVAREVKNMREHVSNAISRECDLDDLQREEFKKWKEQNG